MNAHLLFAWLLLGQAPAPVLKEIAPAGGVPGTTQPVTLAGKSLEPIRSLLFDQPGFSASQAAGKPLVWEISIDPGVLPGFYDVRVVNDLGISAPRAFHVSPLPASMGAITKDRPEAEISLGSRVGGSLDAGEMHRFRFRCAEDRRVIAECLAERIDSALDATLEIRDGRGRRMGFSDNAAGLDPLIAFDARKGEEYAIDLWDFTYQGKYPYLLCLYSAPRVLYAFPPVLPPGGTAPITVYGWNLPSSRPVPDSRDGLEALSWTPGPGQAGPPARSYRRMSRSFEGSGEVLFAGEVIEPLLLGSSPRPAASEAEPNDQPQAANPMALPESFHGRFDGASDRDWVKFAAVKGQTYEIEVASALWGTGCDPVFRVVRVEMEKSAAAGAEPDRKIRVLQSADERKRQMPEELLRKMVVFERDPEVLWKAPEDGEYLVEVRNRNHTWGTRSFYQLSIHEPEPSFRVTVMSSSNYSGESIAVPRGGSQALDAIIERYGGFDGPVRLQLEGLPPGLSAAPVHLSSEENFAPLVLTASEDCADWSGPISVRAIAAWRQATIDKSAQGAFTVFGGTETRHPLNFVSSRWTATIPVAVREAAAFAVQLPGGELTAPPGAKLVLPLEVRRRAGYQEDVQLSFQGFNQRAFAGDNGERQNDATVPKDKSRQDLQVNIPASLPYGPHTFMVYASASVEVVENPQASKPKKVKQKHTYASNPLVIRLIPPLSVALEAPEASGPAGAPLRIPFTIGRAAGVEGEAEVTIELPKEAKGFSVKAVKLGKDSPGGELILQGDGKMLRGKLEGAAVRARVSFAGRQFEEKAPLSVELLAPVRIGGRVECGKPGVWRFELARHPRFFPGEKVQASIQATAPGNRKAVLQAAFAADRLEAACLLDAGAAWGAADQGIFPLQLEVTLKTAQGSILQPLTILSPKIMDF